MDVWPRDGNQMVTVDDHYLVDSFVGMVEAEPVDLASGELLRKERGKDPQLAHLRRYLLTQREPNEGTVMLWGTTESAQRTAVVVVGWRRSNTAYVKCLQSSKACMGVS